MDEKTLAEISINDTAVVRQVICSPSAKRRLLDLGVVNGTRITALYKSPYNDPTAYLIRGAVIALRKEDSGKILIY